MPMECFRSNGKDQQCCGLPSQGSRRSDISTNDFISAVCTDLSVKAIFAYFLTVLEPASRAALDTPKLGGAACAASSRAGGVVPKPPRLKRIAQEPPGAARLPS